MDDAASRIGHAALLALPGALVIYLSFNAGGYFANTVGFVSVILAQVLVVRALLARRPVEGFSRAALVPVGALSLLLVWAVVSQLWSDAPGRSLLDALRYVPYLLLLVLFATVERSSRDVRWMLRGVAVAIGFVCLASLATRIAPDIWSGEGVDTSRLAYPLTYFNALGLLAALGVVVALHLASDRAEWIGIRVAAAALMPVLAVTLYFTFSRGALLAVAAALVVYAIVGVSRGMVFGVLATAPPTIYAVKAAYDADLLSKDERTSAAAQAQADHVLRVVIACVLIAAVVRLILALLERPLDRVRAPRAVDRPWIASLAVLGVLIIGALAVDAPGRASDAADRLLHGTKNEPAATDDIRARFTTVTSPPRIDHWKKALDDFQKEPLRGSGAGTYAVYWMQHREDPQRVTNAHSAYLENLAELGIVGAALFLLTIAGVLGGLALRTRGPDRTLYAALLAAGAGWAVHLALDWDWEMPATGLWLFAFAGIALAKPRRPREPAEAVALEPAPTLATRTRVALAVGWLVVAAGPLSIAIAGSHQQDGIDAFVAGDCRTATTQAKKAIDSFGVWSEPHQILGYCAADQRQRARSIAAMRRAVDLDPDSWEAATGLAIVTARAREDARTLTRRALALNPMEGVLQQFAKDVRSRPPARQGPVALDAQRQLFSAGRMAVVTH